MIIYQLSCKDFILEYLTVMLSDEITEEDIESDFDSEEFVDDPIKKSFVYE